jgi:hypothetical protein
MTTQCPNCYEPIQANEPITICMNCAAILKVTDNIEILAPQAIAQMAGQNPTRVYNILTAQNNVRKSRRDSVSADLSVRIAAKANNSIAAKA